MSTELDVFELGSVCVAFSNRHGGCSSKPFDSLNLGAHVGDDLGDVFRNRELLHKALDHQFVVPPHSSWSFLDQTHEDNLVLVDRNTVIDNSYPPTADASVTQIKNQPLVIMTADCGPLVIAGQSIVSVVHASWKTVAAGLIESVFTELQYLAPGDSFSALLGPCIHPESYEFDPELLSKLSNKLGAHVAAQTKEGKPAFDLPESIKYECTSRGIEFRDVSIDTFASPSHFSYRRDGLTGRQGVIAWLK